MVYVLFAEGFEEIEAITPIDMLRRAGIEVSLVGVSQMNVTGAHGITIAMDIPLSQVNLDDMEMVMIPGGLGCVDGVMNSPDALTLIEKSAQKGAWVSAICAAPTILVRLGLLDGRRAICYPTMADQMGSAVVHPGHGVVTDGQFITGRAAGISFRFGAQLIRALKGDEAADAVLNAICY